MNKKQILRLLLILNIFAHVGVGHSDENTIILSRQDEDGLSHARAASFASQLKALAVGFSATDSGSMIMLEERSVDPVLLQTIIDEARKDGFDVERDQRVIFSQVSNTQSLRNPGTPAYFIEPTKVARLLGNTPEYAHFYTKGNNQGILTLDFGFDSQENLYDVRPPDNYVSGQSGAVDLGPHGSLVSYVIHALDDSRFSIGVCPNCPRYFYNLNRPLSNGASSATVFLSEILFDVFQILERFSAPANTTRILNLSWGIPWYSPALDSILKRARNNGFSIVAASGNNDGALPIFPASLPYVVGAGASGFERSDGTIDPLRTASFSNGGVDVVAPGSHVKIPQKTTYSPIITFMANFDGTSFAAPYISGALGLLRSYVSTNLTSFGYLFNAGVTPRQRAEYFEGLLKTTATDIEEPGFDNRSGHGLINVGAAINALRVESVSRANPLSANLKRGIVEDIQSKIFDEVKQRVRASNPISKLVFGKATNISEGIFDIEISRPRLYVGATAPNFETSALLNGNLKTILSASINLAGYVHVKVGIAGVPIGKTTVNISLRPAEGESNIIAVEMEHELGATGYIVKNSKYFSPILSTPNVAVENLPPFLESLLPNFEDQIDPDLIKMVGEILPQVFVQQFGLLSEQIVANSISVKRDKLAEYFQARSVAPNSAPNLSYLIEHNVLGETRSSHGIDGSIETVSDVLATRPAPISNILDYPPLGGGTPTNLKHQRSAEISTSVDFLKAQIAHLIAKGVFDFNQYPDFQNVSFTTGTSLNPAGVTFEFSNTLLTGYPTIQFNPQGPNNSRNPLTISYEFYSELEVAGVTSPVLISYRLPISSASVYKELGRETDRTIEPASFHDRVVVDSRNYSVTITPLANEFLEGIASSATLKDIGDVFHFTLGQKVIRATNALSTASIFLNMNLGNHWGCLGELTKLLNEELIRRAIPEEYQIELMEQSSCIDLRNVANLRPDSDRPSYGVDSNFFVSMINLTDRAEAKEPRAAHGLSRPSVDILETEHGLYRGGKAEISFIQSGLVSDVLEPAGQIQFATPDFRDAFQPQVGGVQPAANIHLVENLWQLGISSSERIYVLVPKRNQAAASPYEMIGIGRNNRELNRQIDCMPQVSVTFNYNGTQPNISSGYATNYRENAVTPNSIDTWTSRQSCEGIISGSSGGRRDTSSIYSD